MRDVALRVLRRAPFIRPIWDRYERLLTERDALLAEREAALAERQAGGPPADAGIGGIDFERFIADCRRVLDAPPGFRRQVEDRGVVLLPADFNAPVPLLRDLEGGFEGSAPLYDRIFDLPLIRASLTAMVPFAAEFDPPATGDEQTASEFF